MSPEPWHRYSRRPLVFGHRGAMAREVENTIEAFTLARVEGADGIELDVRACATGEAVVFHDATLARLAGRGHRVEDLSLADLRSVKLNGGRRIPTLDDVIEHVGDSMLINIEIKSPRLFRAQREVDAALACLERHGDKVVERVLLSSFDPVAVWRVRRRAAHLRTGFLFHKGAPVVLKRAWVAPFIRPFALHPENVLITEERAQTWRRRGFAINAWTVDDPGRLRALAALGVDIVMANDPGAALTALTE